MKPVYAKTSYGGHVERVRERGRLRGAEEGRHGRRRGSRRAGRARLTVPEATGLGSGGVLLYYDARGKTLQAYDGRETAPAAATENYLRYVDDATDRSRRCRTHGRAAARSARSACRG